MSRKIRNTAILAKLETTYGVDAEPTGSADAVLVSDLSITPFEAQNVDRALIRPFFGGSEQLVGTKQVNCSFSIELAGSGTSGTAPQWGDLLQACAFGEASLTSPARNEYSPVTNGLKSLTVYWYDDGVLHKLLGAMGTVTISANVGERPMLQFQFTGLYGGVTAAANPSVTLSTWKTPPVMTMANVVDVTLGATYAAGALTGGTEYASTGLSIDVANQVAFTPLLSTEFVDITDRAMTGSTQLRLSASEEAAFYASIETNAVQSLAITIGTAAGNQIVLFAPSVQLLNPSKQDLNGNRMVGVDLRLVPVAGNDELRIVAL